SKQHIFHGYLHVVWIVLREDLAIIRLPARSAHAISFSKKGNRGAEIPVSWRTMVSPASTTSRLTDAPSMTARVAHRPFSGRGAHPKPRHAPAFRLERRPTQA